MDNKLALKRFSELVDNEQNRMSEYKNILKASTILQEKICKIAIIGSQSKGKSLLINLLAKSDIATKKSIPIPIYISSSIQTIDKMEQSEFCYNNSVGNLAQPGSFVWNQTGSRKCDRVQSLDNLLSSTVGASGALMEFTNTSHEIAKNASILLPPDFCQDSKATFRKHHILNAADVADIILIVATPEELNSKCYDFLYNSREAIQNKIIITFVIHAEISNFFHYPLALKSEEASAVEQRQKMSAKRNYDTIKEPYTSEDMSQDIKNGIMTDTKNVLQKIEKLIKENFKETHLFNAYFLPILEKPSSHQEISEDQKIISDVKNWQLERIYTELVQVIRKVSGGAPAIAWEYFFRKSEDVCFDMLTPFIQKLKSQMVANYSRSKVIEHLLAIQKDELEILLRDYSVKVNEDELQKYFQELRVKKLGGLFSQSKEKQNQLQNNIRDSIDNTTYGRMVGRIKRLYDLDMPSPEQIKDESLSRAPTHEDSSQFLQCIKERISKENITEYWQKHSPLIAEKQNIQQKEMKKVTETQKSIINILDAWIEISKLVDCEDKIDFLIKIRSEIASFLPEKLFNLR